MDMRDVITEEDWTDERIAEAEEILSSPKADVFAWALDMLGWKIVSQYPPDFPGQDVRWPLNDPLPDRIPWWADPCDGSPPVDPPDFTLIDGGEKADDDAAALRSAFGGLKQNGRADWLNLLARRLISRLDRQEAVDRAGLRLGCGLTPVRVGCRLA
jgi:hypothetical protein